MSDEETVVISRQDLVSIAENCVSSRYFDNFWEEIAAAEIAEPNDAAQSEAEQESPTGPRSAYSSREIEDMFDYKETIEMLRWYCGARGVNEEESAMASQAVLREFEAAEDRRKERMRQRA